METCLNIKQNFSDAGMLKKLEGSGQLDWYSLWFGYKEEKVQRKSSRKEITFKALLGAAMKDL